MNGVVPKVTAFDETAALWALMQGDTARAREIITTMSEPERFDFEQRLTELINLVWAGRDVQGRPDGTCRNCPHPIALHDREGCTLTIPCDDPDFGPTQTCPCCERGPRG